VAWTAKVWCARSKNALCTWWIVLALHTYMHDCQVHSNKYSRQLMCWKFRILPVLCMCPVQYLLQQRWILIQTLHSTVWNSPPIWYISDRPPKTPSWLEFHLGVKWNFVLKLENRQKVCLWWDKAFWLWGVDAFLISNLFLAHLTI
jgi:hypothetical protein